MITLIQKKIYKYSESIFPHYSVSSSLENKNKRSTNALIYHALVCLHLGKIDQANSIKETCISNLKKRKNNKSINNKKHSAFYKDLHKAALITQLICSTQNNFRNIDTFLKTILDERNFNLISNKAYFIKKIKSLKMNNSWHDSNIIMAMFSLRFAYVQGFKKDIALNSCIDYLSKIQNSKTGLWHSNNNFGGDLNAMAGTYHYLPLFLSINRAIPHKEKIINSTIKLNLNNGHFSAPKGHSCVDLDAHAILFYCKNNICEDSNKKIKRLALRFIRDMKYISNKDGGFSDFPTNYKLNELFIIILILIYKLILHKSTYTFLWNLKAILRTLPIVNNKIKINSNSDIMCTSYIKESNIFSCWFKLLTIDYANKNQQNVKEEKEPKTYLLPFIGFGL